MFHGVDQRWSLWHVCFVPLSVLELVVIFFSIFLPSDNRQEVPYLYLEDRAIVKIPKSCTCLMTFRCIKEKLINFSCIEDVDGRSTLFYHKKCLFSYELVFSLQMAKRLTHVAKAEGLEVNDVRCGTLCFYLN